MVIKGNRRELKLPLPILLENSVTFIAAGPSHSAFITCMYLLNSEIS